MTPAPLDEGIVERLDWLIRKDGYFYRPNKSGYTTEKHAAGRYSEADARRECEVEPWHMKAIHQDEWPDDAVSAAYKEKDAEITALRAHLVVKNEALNAAYEKCAQIADEQEVGLRYEDAKHGGRTFEVAANIARRIAARIRAHAALNGEKT